MDHAAGRLGSGSDVLGLDDEVSRDHDWGCRLTLLVEPERVEFLDQLLERELPLEFLGYPVRFATSWDPVVRHRVEINGVREFAASRLGAIPETPVDWLLVPGQSFLELTAGPVFHDDSDQLTRLRSRLQWYPQDVWLYVLACGWSRLNQDFPLWERTRQRRDRLGADLLEARIRRHLVYLAFMVERRWPAYPKWVGRLLGRELGQPWAAVERLHRQLLGLGLDNVPLREAFFDRGYDTPHCQVAQQLYDRIQDPAVLALPRGLGSLEQWCDNPSLLERSRAAALYRPS